MSWEPACCSSDSAISSKVRDLAQFLRCMGQAGAGAKMALSQAPRGIGERGHRPQHQHVACRQRGHKARSTTAKAIVRGMSALAYTRRVTEA